MATVTELGQTGLQGWRQKVADGISQPVANRAPLEEDQVRRCNRGCFLRLGCDLRRQDHFGGYAPSAPRLRHRATVGLTKAAAARRPRRAAASHGNTSALRTVSRSRCQAKGAAARTLLA
jgi:hypothetical protein